MSDRIDRSKWILLVDDSPLTADIVREALEPFGYRVTWVEDGANVPEMLAQGLPALILLDVMMPRMDGFSVLEIIRAGFETARLPVILLTAKGEEADIVTGLELGADDYITKPLNAKQLLDLVKSHLKE